MIGIVVAVALVLALITLGLLVVTGHSADTRQPGRRWYPAGPDIKP
jgi:hypothetical protein